MRNNLNKIQWCPGCWDYMVLWAIRSVIKELWIPKENVVIVSWIGCSWKMSQYIDSYGAETLHGRSIPFAVGVKLANPELTVIAVGWDWDWYGIWLWHFLHACRRNIDITYIVCDNQNYGLTTWQASPTTPLCAKTRSTPAGNSLTPFDPLLLASSAGCQYNQSVVDKDIIGLKNTIKEWILFKGFSHINVKQACPSWNKW